MPVVDRFSQVRRLGIVHKKTILWRKGKAFLELYLLFFALILLFEAESTLARAGAQVSTASATEEIRTHSIRSEMNEESILVVFSDVDGTLVHYSENRKIVGEQEKSNNRILDLPPSATGMKGVISSLTLRRCQEIRRRGVKLVLVSGMRTPTMLKRLPYLPRADAYSCEAGGRIFYPCKARAGEPENLILPLPYDGASQEDLEPFSLVEDMEWRSRQEKSDAAGKDGFVGCDLVSVGEDQLPLKKRNGLLWSFARELTGRGFVVDSRGYATCFRVNRKHQKIERFDDFDALSRGVLPQPDGLSMSTNLGCVDFYPSSTGKKNCCKYLAEKFYGTVHDVMAKRTVCLCDDDNDVEMALACSHAFIPSVSSESLALVLDSHSQHFTRTTGNGVEGTDATDAALALVLARTSTDESATG